MKALLFLLIVSLFWQPLEAQTNQYFKKVNDSTVYRFETVSKQIRVGSVIPAICDGYSCPRIEDGTDRYPWILVVYEKFIDSFRFIGNKCTISKYDFEAAYKSSKVLLWKQRTNISFSSYFATKTHHGKGETLAFDPRTKSFLLEQFTYSNNYIPWTRWLFVLMIWAGLIWVIVVIVGNSLEQQTVMPPLAIAVCAVVSTLISGLWTWFVFWLGDNVPKPTLDQTGQIYPIQFYSFIATGIIRWIVFAMKKNTEPTPA